MNEQIEKIYGEACITAGYLDEREFLEKFAELIIRKCAKVADLANENKCEWIGGNILVHFGVQE
jgi:hypothetical protein